MLAAALLLIAASPSAAALSPHFEGWPREQLEAERVRLAATRPSIALPIGLLAGGVASIGSSVLSLIISGARAALGPSSPVGTRGIPIESIAFAAVDGGIGVVLVIVGLVLFLPRLKERRAIGEQLDQLDRQLERSVTSRPRPAVGVTVTLARF